MRSDFYLDERQRKKRRRILKLKIYGGVFLFFMLAIGAACLIAYSPLFKLRQINITWINADEKQLDTNKIIEEFKNFFVGQSKIASFLGPDNILIWDNEKLAEFKRNPRIAEITIEKDYFKRQIKINIKERKRFGIWCPSSLEQCNVDALANATCSKGEGCFWFDKNGVIFSEAPIVEGNLIYKIDDFSGRSLKLGEPVLAEKFFLNLLKIFDILEKSDLGIKSLKLERFELQEIATESSPKIYFSLRIDPNFGLSTIESLKKTGLNRIEYIDLRVENRAYYKMK